MTALRLILAALAAGLVALVVRVAWRYYGILNVDWDSELAQLTHP